MKQGESEDIRHRIEFVSSNSEVWLLENGQAWAPGVVDESTMLERCESNSFITFTL